MKSPDRNEKGILSSATAVLSDLTARLNNQWFSHFTTDKQSNLESHSVYARLI